MQIVYPIDFTGENNIPDTDANHVQQQLNSFIAKYEGRLCRIVLGADLYKQLIEGLRPETPLQSWSTLAEAIKPAIVNYVYYHWLENEHTYSGPNGEAKVLSQNAVNVSPELKMVRAWNEMVKINYQVVQHIIGNTAYYGAYYNMYVYNYQYRHLCAPEFRKINRFGI